jgi:hypothetical protein
LHRWSGLHHGAMKGRRWEKKKNHDRSRSFRALFKGR